MLRIPFILLWNLLKNILYFPLRLIQLFFRIPKESTIHIEIHKTILRWEQNSFLQWWSNAPEDLTLGEWKTHLETLATSDRVEGIVCEIHELSTGWPQVEELRGLLQTFRDQNKRVTIYAHNLGPIECYLSSAADDLLVSPAANVHLTTPTANVMFFGETLEMFGVKPHFYAVGEHKTAPEMFTRSFPTPTNREDIKRTLREYRANFFKHIAARKDTTQEALEEIFEQGIFTIEEAHEHGLIDAVRYMDRVAAYLKEKAPSAFETLEMPQLEHTYTALDRTNESHTELTDSKETKESESDAPKKETESEATSEESENETASEESENETTSEASESGAPTEEKEAETKSEEKETEEKDEDDEDEPELADLSDFYTGRPRFWTWTPLRKGPQIAVIPVEGIIKDEAGDNGFSQEEAAVKDAVLESIEEARNSRRVKAAIVYIDSRGGSAHASEAIWYAVKQLSAEKPVIAYMENYAASGGYYIAAGAETIIASPWTITGSIGVFGGKFVVQSLLHKLRIGHTAVDESPGSLVFSPFKEPTAVEDARIESQMALFYKRFLARVAESRDMSVDEVHAIAQGKVYFGQEALSINLVDSCGTFESAYQKARELANIKKKTELRICRSNKGLSRLSMLRGFQGHMTAPQTAQPFNEYMELLQLLSRGQLIAWQDGLHFFPPQVPIHEILKWKQLLP